MKVQSLGQEDPLEEGMATHSSILAWRIPRTEALGYSPQGCKGLDMTEATTHARDDKTLLLGLPVRVFPVENSIWIGRMNIEDNLHHGNWASSNPMMA